jgi:hypothetical protein
MVHLRSVGTLALLSAAAALPATKRWAAPVVDLGYASYQGVYNETTNIQSFQGIRYAAPPTGNLRWRAPQPPAATHGPNTDRNAFRELWAGRRSTACWSELRLRSRSRQRIACSSTSTFLPMRPSGRALGLLLSGSTEEGIPLVRELSLVSRIGSHIAWCLPLLYASQQPVCPAQQRFHLRRHQLSSCPVWVLGRKRGRGGGWSECRSA